MPAYALFDNIRIDDVRRLEEYKVAVAPITAKYGGRYVVLGGRTELKEGEHKPVFPVMIEFPTLEHASAWYGSEDYRALKALRLSAGSFNAVFFEGLPAQPTPVWPARLVIHQQRREGDEETHRGRRSLWRESRGGSVRGRKVGRPRSSGASRGRRPAAAGLEE